nr:MAG TPA: hypothetical protein [Caudoviricetes sp.]
MYICFNLLFISTCLALSLNLFIVMIVYLAFNSLTSGKSLNLIAFCITKRFMNQ